MLSTWQQKENTFSTEGKWSSIDANYLKHEYSSLFGCLQALIVFTEVKVLLLWLPWLPHIGGKPVPLPPYCTVLPRICCSECGKLALWRLGNQVTLYSTITPFWRRIPSASSAVARLGIPNKFTHCSNKRFGGRGWGFLWVQDTSDLSVVFIFF